MVPKSEQQVYVARIEHALTAAANVAKTFVAGTFHVQDNGGRHVITEVDRRISDVLRGSLPKPEEGWLSEEDVDDKSRLGRNIVWVVDPLDGTREFVDGLPEWCISVGLVVEGKAIAGGICNPATGEVFLGAMDCGVTYNGKPAQTTARRDLNGALVLASRQECKRGEWKLFESGPFTVRPMGSVAYKLALVSAGLADATWTLSPKHEWDVAAGVALVKAAGGEIGTIKNAKLEFNQPAPLLPGLIASGKSLWEEIGHQLAATDSTILEK